MVVFVVPLEDHKTKQTVKKTHPFGVARKASATGSGALRRPDSAGTNLSRNEATGSVRALQMTRTE